MAELIWTERAVNSLELIYDYIAVDSSEFARFQINRITNAIERLRQFPQSGRLVPELIQSPYREVIVNAYRAIYRYDAGHDRVYIVNIVHGRRLLTEQLLPEDP